MLVCLQNLWIYPNLVRRQEKFCNACEDDRVLQCEIHVNRIQGNDLGVGWIDHHTDLLLLFALLCGTVNLSDLPIVERRRSKPCLILRMV